MDLHDTRKHRLSTSETSSAEPLLLDRGKSSKKSQLACWANSVPSAVNSTGQQTQTWFHRLWKSFRRRTNNVPLLLLVMYFAHAWMTTFPLTAFTGWLLDDIRMSSGQQTDFYALEFLPYCFKPFYGWISDNYPLRGYHCKTYIQIAGITSALAYG